MTSRTITSALALLAAPCVLLSACSSSGKAASGGTAAGIHIGIVADVTPGALGTGEPEAPLAAKAAVAAVNKAGGINGKKLELTVCDAKGDANQTTTCARNLAADRTIVAVVGSTSVAAPLEPVLEKTNLVDFGAFPALADDFTSKVSFPLIGGPNVLLPGAGQLVVTHLTPKPTKVGFAYLGLPGFGAQATALNATLKPAGAKVTKSVALPPGASDISAQVASSTSGNDAVVVGDVAAGLTQYVKTAAQSNTKIPIVLGSSISVAQIKSLGSAANGVYETSDYRPPTNDFAGGKQFLSETKNAGSGFAIAESSVTAWLAVHVLADQLKKLTTITRASVYAMAGKITAADTYGFTPSVDFSKPSTILGGKFPRLVGHSVYLVRIENSQPTLLQSDPVDVG